jgi:hypothetical protein
MWRVGPWMPQSQQDFTVVASASSRSAAGAKFSCSRR